MVVEVEREAIFRYNKKVCCCSYHSWLVLGMRLALVVLLLVIGSHSGGFLVNDGWWLSVDGDAEYVSCWLRLIRC